MRDWNRRREIHKGNWFHYSPHNRQHRYMLYNLSKSCLSTDVATNCRRFRKLYVQILRLKDEKKSFFMTSHVSHPVKFYFIYSLEVSNPSMKDGQSALATVLAGVSWKQAHPSNSPTQYVPIRNKRTCLQLCNLTTMKKYEEVITLEEFYSTLDTWLFILANILV